MFICDMYVLMQNIYWFPFSKPVYYALTVRHMIPLMRPDHTGRRDGGENMNGRFWEILEDLVRSHHTCYLGAITVETDLF